MTQTGQLKKRRRKEPYKQDCVSKRKRRKGRLNKKTEKKKTQKKEKDNKERERASMRKRIRNTGQYGNQKERYDNLT